MPAEVAAPSTDSNDDDIQPRAFVLEKVAKIQPAKTSQPDYNRMVREEQAQSSVHPCPACKADVEVVTCQIHNCSETFVLNQDKRRICASCWYERSSVSIGEYLEEEEKDTHCSSCPAEFTAS